jgi:RND family efflux transporter MFP subunit
MAAVAALAAAVGFEFGTNRMEIHMPQTAIAAPASPEKPARKIKYYWDPMLGPSSISDKPGKSAMGMELEPVYDDDSTSGAAESSGGPEVRIDGAIVQNMGVRTAQVTRGPLSKSIRTVGILRVPEPSQHDITLKVNGWIEKLFANQEGMHIQQGQPLFEVYSPDLQVAEEELIGAVRSLASLDASTSDDLRRQTQALVDSAKRKLRLWDVADQDIDAIAAATTALRTVIFRSPATGDVTDKAVVAGSSITAGMKLMQIDDRSTLWLDTVVYENQVSLVSIGQDVQATSESFPGKTFNGTISFIYPRVDASTRTVTVRTVIDNADALLTPGQYVTADIATKPLPDVIQAPREAIIDTGTRQIAFVVKTAGHFDPVEVKMGLVGDGEQAQIVSGLQPGDTVVTSGQFLFDVESRTTEAINKLRPTRSGQDSATASANGGRP